MLYKSTIEDNFSIFLTILKKIFIKDSYINVFFSYEFVFKDIELSEFYRYFFSTYFNCRLLCEGWTLKSISEIYY